MEVIKTPIAGLLIFQPQVFRDERGYFFENFRQSTLQENGVDVKFVQDNESMSMRGSLRGLHFQAPPHAQDKLIRVVRGSIMDVVVDIRTQSPTFGQCYQLELNEENKRSFFVPAGFAHGFCCLTDHTIVQYKCSAYYNKSAENGIRWNDETLDIEWPDITPIVSEKDQQLPKFSDLHSPF